MFFITRRLSFADAKIVTAKSAHGLERMLGRPNTSINTIGLKTNVNKRKIILIERTDEKTVSNISLDQERIEQVNNHEHFECLFTNARKIDA